MSHESQFSVVSSLPDLAIKLARYCLVSAIVVPTGSLILWLLLRSDVPAGYANAISVAATTPISYLLNRRWTWQRAGLTGGLGEVAAFWWMTAIGLMLSSGTVALASRWTSTAEILVVVNISTFGVIWVAKFFVLDRLLFKPREHAVDRMVDAGGSYSSLGLSSTSSGPAWE